MIYAFKKLIDNLLMCHQVTIVQNEERQFSRFPALLSAENSIWGNPRPFLAPTRFW